MHFDDFVMEGVCLQAVVIGGCIGYFQWQLFFYNFNDTLDGFHRKRRAYHEKANEPASYYCHDKGYFKRDCKDFLINITRARVSKVWTWILLQANLTSMNLQKRTVRIPAGISLPSSPNSHSGSFSAKNSWNQVTQEWKYESKRQNKKCVVMTCLINLIIVIILDL